MNVGDIYIENDKRRVRYVQILEGGEGRRFIKIRTVRKDGTGTALNPYWWAPTARPTWADRERFHDGPAGSGYSLYEAVPK